MDLNGKRAFVTGAAKRVGRAIALELARGGCDVAIHYRNSDQEARRVASEMEALGRRALLIQGDLARPAETLAMIREIDTAWGGLDILVNNASVFEPTPLPEELPDTAELEREVAEWERIFRVNVIAPAMLARQAAVLMRRAGRGCILNLTDILADRPMREHDAYCASKAALASLTRSLARELAPAITVNAIAPGVAKFPDDYDEATKAKVIRRIPLQREGAPEELARLAVALLREGDFVTGQILPYDGGRSIAP